uniref:D-lactate dehydrogenase (cytochrome) n=1 Tax=Haemonchus placei TaxID=6290 RepID=A0A0N4WV44_HAEPC
LSPLVSSCISKFEAILGKEAVSTKESIRAQYSKDEAASFRPHLPSVVLLPTSVEQISAVVRVCNEQKIPIVPFGTGTGLEGGSVSLMDGVCISALNIEGGICELNEADFDVAVRPSVTRKQLNDHIRNTGLFFPVDPGADASLCGMCATSASGTNAVRYGTMKENVRNLEVVLADGSVLHTRGKGTRTRKSAAGYNLTELFIGSEGTLGIITKAVLRLHPRPQAQAVALCHFPTVADAVNSVVETLQMAVPVARIEFLDDVQVAACNVYSKLSLAEQPTIALEFHGQNENEVAEQAKFVEVCTNNRGSAFEWAVELEEMEKLWAARHNAYYAALAMRTGAVGFTTDVCVPISKLAETIVQTKEDLENLSLKGAIVGHVGDGNFHVILPVFEENCEEMKIVRAFSDRLVRRALSANGTCTGEHGIGVGKIPYLVEEFGPIGVQIMKNIKRALDPNGIMNPGKVFV